MRYYVLNGHFRAEVSNKKIPKQIQLGDVHNNVYRHRHSRPIPQNTSDAENRYLKFSYYLKKYFSSGKVGGFLGVSVFIVNVFIIIVYSYDYII